MLTIDKDVPRKGAGGKRLSERNKMIYDAMDKMEIGDSFSLPEHSRNISATVTKRGNVIGKRFSTRLQSDGSVRVWRVNAHPEGSKPRTGRPRKAVVEQNAQELNEMISAAEAN
jgi:hypothetical protein